MTNRVREIIRYNEEHGKTVRLTRKAMADLERLMTAYKMNRRMDVLEYLIEQGVKGLEAAEGQGLLREVGNDSAN